MATDSVRPLEHQLRLLQSNPLCSHPRASTELTLLNRVSVPSNGALSGRFDEAKTVGQFQQNIFHKRQKKNQHEIAPFYLTLNGNC
jgi:hypothetical protein